MRYIIGYICIMPTKTDTEDRILLATLEAFLGQGVKKTSIEEIAQKVGVTRVTVYRYYGDRKGLVRAVCLRVAAIFQKAAEGGDDEPMEQVDRRLARLIANLSALPRGNLLASFEEVRRIYPAVYEEYRSARQKAVDRIFTHALQAARREGMLREGLNPEVLKAIFWAAVMGVVENPSLVSSGVPLAEIASTVTEVFRHGILRSDTVRED